MIKGFIELRRSLNGRKTLIAVKDILAVQPSDTGTEVYFSAPLFENSEFRDEYEDVKQLIAEAWDTRAETEAEKKIKQIRACIESYRIKKNESNAFEYGRFQEWRAIKTDIDEILEAPHDNA